MSPVYKELLLKLVMSMSRDELFIRSKNIMDQEKMKSGSSKLPNSNLDALALLQQAMPPAPAPTIPATAPPTVTKSSGFGSLLGFKKQFLSKKSKTSTTAAASEPSTASKANNSNNNNSKSVNKKSALGLSVGSKATGSARRKNSTKRRRGKVIVSTNVENVKNSVVIVAPNNSDSNAISNNQPASKSVKKKFSKSDISQPIPVRITLMKHLHL